MARSILEIAKSAASKIGIATPALLIGATDATAVEMLSVMKEVAERIVRSHDWQAIKSIHVMPGDGVAEGFALPQDYLRMPKDAQIWSSRLNGPLCRISAEEYLHYQVSASSPIINSWTIMGDEVKFAPPMASGETARFIYLSKTAVKPASGANKETFTLDTDTFRLGDRLLELQFIWEWRSRKGLPYAEDMQTAEIALAQAISDDKGARVVSQASRLPSGAQMAYPWNITP